MCVYVMGREPSTLYTSKNEHEVAPVLAEMTSVVEDLTFSVIIVCFLMCPRISKSEGTSLNIFCSTMCFVFISGHEHILEHLLFNDVLLSRLDT